MLVIQKTLKALPGSRIQDGEYGPEGLAEHYHALN